MPNRTLHFARRAFSLVEMAMVIAIGGLMLSFALESQQASAPSADCYTTTKAQLMTISTAVDTFARKNDRLPFPASLTAKIEDITYGREDSTGTQTTVVGTLANAATWGAIPFQTLGLAPSYGVDCWGNKIVYIVTNYLTNNGATNGYLDGNTFGTITLKNSTTNTTSSAIGYAAISLGADALGAVKANSSATPWCTYNSANIATYNCSPSASTTNTTIADTVFNDGKNAGASYFDDVIVAAAKPQIPYKTNLYCWGNSAGGGHLGDGSLAAHMSSSPAVAHTNTIFAQFGNTEIDNYASKNSDHNCALAVDGTANCWGNNANYGLGNSTTVNNAIPLPVNTTTKFKKLFAVGSTNIGIGLTDDQFYCWGLQYGLCTTAGYSKPYIFNGGITFQSLDSTVDNHMGCALGTDSQAYCWAAIGDNEQRGRGTTPSPANDNKPVPVSGGHKFSKIVTVNGGDTCGLTSAADPGGADYEYCWGGNVQGTLGVGDQTARYVPTLVPGHTFSNIFTAVSSMYAVGDAADANPGLMYAWGQNVVGMLGVGGTNGVDWGSFPNSSLTMYTVTNVNKVSPGTVTTSTAHGFSNGDIVGIFTDPTIGVGTASTGITLSQQNFMIGSVTSNSFNLYQTDGTQFTIEYAGNAYSATTNITNITQANPPVVTTATPHGYVNGATLFVIEVGGMTQVNKHAYTVENVTANTFELWSSATVPADSTAWGAYTSGGRAGNFLVTAKKPVGCYNNYFGSFGICKWSPTLVDTTYMKPPYVTPAASTLFVNVTGQNNTNIGLTSDGKIFGWGQGYSYQIGSANFNQTVVSPKLVPMPAGVVARKITAESWYMGCALATDKNIYCWGQNSDGEAGVGTTSIVANPTKIVGGNQWIDFDMPQTATECALKYDPTVDCDTQNVTWGACSAKAWAQVNGSTKTITSTDPLHPGSASFICTNTVLTQTGGSTCM